MSRQTRAACASASQAAAAPASATTSAFDSKPRERDRVYRYEYAETPVQIFVDPKSFLYLSGMVLDFEETIMRQGFNFINPHSTKSCGCGSSFTA